MNLHENIRLALRSIQSNMLRTVLTLLIISFGIMALIGILTATEGIKESMIQNFKQMGSNTFGIRNEGFIKRGGGPKEGGKREKAENPYISPQQAVQFAKTFKYPATISLSWMAQGSVTVKHESYKTNPNVRVWGVDENYLKVSGLNIGKGRNFTKAEVENGQLVAIVGKDVIAKVFRPGDNIIGEFISLGSNKVRIIGLQAAKGSSQGGTDNQILLPYPTARRFYPSENANFIVNVMTQSTEELDIAIDEAIGAMRNIRKLNVADENDFEIAKSERLANKILDQLKSVKYATIIIGILTLLSAGIGLMNIMLVSVNERTREIGISKAIGATKRIIRIQFLTEAIVICQIGGVIGIIVGVMLGNVVSLITQSGFVFPWVWVLSGIVFTFIVGLAAGLYPAIKASNLDPVEALRYE
ncbi:MAG: ABC transporter permease [Chitinophagales bacterium]